MCAALDTGEPGTENRRVRNGGRPRQPEGVLASRRKHARRRPRDAAEASRKRTAARVEKFVRPKRPPTPGPVRLIESDRLWPAVWTGLSAVLFFLCFPQKLGPLEIELGPLAFVCLVPFVLGSVSIRGTWRGGLWAMLAGWAAMLGGL